MPARIPLLHPSRRTTAGLLLVVLLALTATLRPAVAASVTLSNLSQTYNGSQKPVTVTTVPAGLTVQVTYAGSSTAPTNAGSYAVVATIVDAVETGSATGTLVVAKASQTISFNGFVKTYGDAPFVPSATSTSGLPILFSSANTAVATTSGATVTILAAGTSNLTASQPGNENYLAATNVVRAMTVNKKPQVLTLTGVPATSSYGAAPFAVAATSNIGWPVTAFECDDPLVATVAGNVVSITGAGRVSVIATHPGDANHLAGWIAKPLTVQPSAAPMPEGTRTYVYDGSAKGIDATSLPTGLAAQTTYRDTDLAAPAATPQVVYQNGPDDLALSYASRGMQANGLWGLGKFVTLGGTARKLDSCEATLVTWAKYVSSATDANYGYKEWADANPAIVVPPTGSTSVPGNSGGWYHPVTFAFHEYDSTSPQTWRLLGTKTVQAFIPWRPLKAADGVAAYPYSGYAFRVACDFPDGIVLPYDVWVSVSFNTQTCGIAPIGVKGPYNSLNISSPSGADLAGTTLLASYTLFYKDWRWQASSGGAGPMLRLRAVATNEMIAPPVDAGTYEVKVRPAAAGGGGPFASATGITPAPLAIQLDALEQLRDGEPKPVGVTTTPPGVATAVSYDGAATAPALPGFYAVTAVSANPNYSGTAAGTLHIGDTMNSWRTAVFLNSGLPADQTTDTADPDGDGIPNFLEYACGSSPTTGNAGLLANPRAQGDAFVLDYRCNLHATDVTHVFEATPNLADPLSWTEVTPVGESILADDGSTRTIRATLPVPAGQTQRFFRLKARR